MGRSKGKLSKGQPKGTRSASGRKRDRTPARAVANIGIVRRRELYRVADNNTDTCDAIGRAYTAGLLGTGEPAMNMLLAGRKIAAAYWRVYGFPTADSLARFQPQHGAGPADPETEKRREDALNASIAKVQACGRDVRRAFDQLVIDMNPDSGPAWLDAIVWAGRQRRAPSERDARMMALAIDGLNAIA